MSSSSSTSISAALEDHSPIFGIRLWIVVVVLSILFVLFLIITFLCLFLPRHKSYEPRFRLSKPFTPKTNLCRNKEHDPSFGRRLLPLIGSDVLEAQWPSQKGAPDSNSPTPTLLGSGIARCYTAKEMEVATDRFGRGNLIGSGDSGGVYRGILFDGKRVAVKRFLNDSNAYDDDEEKEKLKFELDAMAKIRHGNLVDLLGYCLDRDTRALVYEYVDNGSLHRWLHEYNREISLLTWDTRMAIIRGTAKGLAFLHEESVPGIAHGGIKSSNVLLDHCWSPNISDLGSSSMSFDSGYRTSETDFTHVSAEKKTDVYCFGILIMEIITGKLPVDHAIQSRVHLIDRVKSMIANQEIECLLDSRIPDVPPLKEVKLVVLISLMCVDPDLSQRPSIGKVVRMLEKNYSLVLVENSSDDE